MEDIKKKNEQEFIVETPILIEEKIGKGNEKTRKYERGKFLGKGGFAKCYEMKCLETKKIYAAKVFEKRALSNVRSKKKLINEIKLHKKLHHQNIVNFEHFFEDKENVYILLELCSNQTLNELLKRRKRLSEIEVQCYLIQIIKALKYIHTHKIIHRDVKLGNCFINGKLELKLGDFGLAAKLEYEGQRRKTVCGTPNYIAPEILEKKNGHSYEVDIWSLGVVAYTLIFGRPPFETSDVKLTYKKIKINNFNFPENIKVHPSAKKLIISILNLDPSKRPSLDVILDHEFFKIYTSVPAVLPLSTLACPPALKYVSQFNKNDEHLKYFNLNNSFNNTISNLNLRLGSKNVNSNINQGLQSEIPDLNNNFNMNSAENINISKEIIKRLLHGNGVPLKKKHESSTNLKEENFLEKVNYILKNVGSNGSRNIIKNDINFIDSGNNQGQNVGNIVDSVTAGTTDINQNIINNNFFINVGNLNNMEIKLDESLFKKFEENFLNIANSKILFSNKITKIYDHTSKFGIIYYINNTHIGVCFNDNSNIIKKLSMAVNFAKCTSDSSENNLLNNKNLEYLYIDKDGKNTLNYDEKGFNNFVKNSKNIPSSKDLIKKFEILNHIIIKYSTDISNIIDTAPNNNNKMFYVKKIHKVQNAIMLRLSNKLIQVFFDDKTELIMSTECNEFYCKNKNSEETYDSIETIMNSDNVDLIKRIKFTKNLLIQFVKNQKSKKNPK